MRNTIRTLRLTQWIIGAIVAASLICGERAAAEITDLSPDGFSLTQTAHVAAAPDAVYVALVAPQRWWSSRHTFSGDARNMSLDTHAGGCWCETMPGGGSVQHMTVVYAVPGKVLRLRGAMGPFQAMPVETVLTWTLAPAGDGTDVTVNDAVAGHTKGGLTGIAPVVDRVFAEQLQRLKSFVETGSGDPASDHRP